MLKKCILIAGIVLAPTAVAASGPRPCDIDPTISCTVETPLPTAQPDYGDESPVQNPQIAEQTPSLPVTGPSEVGLVIGLTLTGYLLWAFYKWAAQRRLEEL